MGWLILELLLFILSIYLNCYYFLVLTEKDVDVTSVSTLGAVLLHWLLSSFYCQDQAHLVLTSCEWIQP